jgi:hypothetical protein
MTAITYGRMKTRLLVLLLSGNEILCIRIDWDQGPDVREYIYCQSLLLGYYC